MKQKLTFHLILFLFLFFLVQTGSAQPTDTTHILPEESSDSGASDRESQPDDYWKKNDPHTLTMKLGSYSPGADFTIQRRKGYGAVFIPGSANGPLLELNYDSYGLSYHQSLPPSAEDKLTRGESDFKDFQLRFFGHRNSIELIYQRVSGFVLQDWDLNQVGTRRPDLTTTSYQFNFFQTLSPHYYSNAVTYNQEGLQLKPGGSLILMSSVGKFQIQADYGLTSRLFLPEMGESGDLSQMKVHYGLVGLGYGYIFTKNKFFASFSGFVGYGLRDLNYSTSYSSKSNLASTYRMGLRPIIGLNYNSWLAAASLIVDGTTWSVGESEFQQSGYAVKLMIGHRFSDITLPWINTLL